MTDKLPNSTAEKHVRIKWISEKIGIPFLLLIVGSVITYTWATHGERMRELDYQIISSGTLLQRSLMPDNDIKLTLNGMPVDNATTVTVALFNLSDKDYQNVPLVVEFQNPDGTSPKMISSTATSFPGAVVLPSKPSAQARCEYTLKVVNREETSAWVGNYIFQGSVIPNAAISVIAPGVKAVPLLKQPKPSENSYLAVGGLLGAMLGLPFGAIIGHYEAIKRRK